MVRVRSARSARLVAALSAPLLLGSCLHLAWRIRQQLRDAVEQIARPAPVHARDRERVAQTERVEGRRVWLLAIGIDLVRHDEHGHGGAPQPPGED